MYYGISTVIVSTHSRPKAAGNSRYYFNTTYFSFNTQPPEGGWYAGPEMTQEKLAVSTHSRPKAAGAPIPPAFGLGYCFNTQPPEGGWLKGGYYAFNLLKFQHTAARRRLGCAEITRPQIHRFQHTAARRRLEPLSKALLHQVSQP